MTFHSLTKVFAISVSIILLVGSAPQAEPEIAVICPDRVPPNREFPLLILGNNLGGASITLGGDPIETVIECGDRMVIGLCPPMLPGTHSLSVTTNGGTASGTITIGSLQGLSPSATIECFIEAVNIALEFGCITKVGVAEGLLAKLNAAASSVGSGNPVAAIQQLNAFVKLLEAQAGKSVDNDFASALIRLTQEVAIPRIREVCHAGEFFPGKNFFQCTHKRLHTGVRVGKSRRSNRRDFDIDFKLRTDGGSFTICKGASPNGEIILEVGNESTIQNPNILTASESNSALKSIVLVGEPSEEDSCCHTLTSELSAFLTAFLQIDFGGLGIFAPFNHAEVEIKDAVVTTKLEWLDCDNQLRFFTVEKTLNVKIRCEKGGAEPVTCAIEGTRVTTTTIPNIDPEAPPIVFIEVEDLSEEDEVFESIEDRAGEAVKRSFNATIESVFVEDSFLEFVDAEISTAGTVVVDISNSAGRFALGVLSGRVEKFKLRDETEDIEP